MEHPYTRQANPVRRDQSPSVWLTRCRQLFSPRPLAILLPIGISVLFTVLYMQHTPLAAQQVVNPGAGATASLNDPVGSVPQNSSKLPAQAGGSAVPNQHKSAAGTGAAPKATDNAHTQASSPSVSLKVVCDTVAQKLAVAARQTALAKEDVRHSTQLTLIETSGLLSSLLGGSIDQQLATENALHLAKLQSINTTYTQSLQTAHCL